MGTLLDTDHICHIFASVAIRVVCGPFAMDAVTAVPVMEKAVETEGWKMVYKQIANRQAVLTIADQPVLVTWKRRNKNLYLRVNKDGHACVTAPWAATEAFIRKFVIARVEWLNNQKKKQKESLLNHEWQYVDGERFPLLGHEYILHIETASRNELCRLILSSDRQLILHVHEEMSQCEKAAVMSAGCKELLKRIVREQMPLCEAITGRRASRIDYRYMTSRWGSCNVRTARICLNLALVHYPVSVIRYIIIHELTHLHEPSHNARFHTLMEKFCPEWREARRTLRNETILS